MFFMILTSLALTNFVIFFGRLSKIFLYKVYTRFLHTLQKFSNHFFHIFKKVIDVIILIDYFIFVTVRVFKYLLLAILIICKHFFILFSILFMVKFAFTNIYTNVTSNDNVNTILDGTLPVASMAGVRTDNWQERFMSVFDTPKDTESLDHVFRNYYILTLSYFSVNSFSKNKLLIPLSYCYQFL